MGDGAKQVGPHFFLFVFHAQAFLLLGLGGQGAGDDGDHQKGQKTQRIAGQGEIKGQIGICKNVVDADDAQHGGDEAEEITGGQPGDQQHRKDKDRGGKAVAAVGQAEQRAALHRAEKNDGGNQKVPPGKGEQLGGVMEKLLQGGAFFP